MSNSDENGASEKRKRRIRSVTAQVLASTAKNIILIAAGLAMGFPTVVIPSVYNAPSNATLTLTQEEVSWFGSINFATILIGSILSGTISQKFGRKRSMQVLTIPLLVSWIMFYYSDSALFLCSSVALGGLVGGLLEAPVLTYISEISEPYLRGILSAAAPLSTIFGMFLQYLLGSFINWRTLSLINTATPVVGFIVLFFVPESPHWLLSKNRIEDTQKSLCWLRGWTTKEHIEKEYNELLKDVHPTGEEGDAVAPAKKGFFSFNYKNYMKRTFIIPFLLIMFSFAAAQFTGITTLSTYAVNIFNSFGAPIDAYYATVILGLAQFSGTVACIALIHYTGKRIIAFTSVIGTGLLFGCVGLYGYLYLGVEKLDNGAHVSEHFQGTPNYSWFPMLCLIGGTLFGYFGLRVLPWSIIGEIFPTEIRGFATGVSAGLGYFMGFISNKTFFNMISAFTLSGVFIFYSVLIIVCLIVYYFFLPETEGWSLLEVQEHFAGKRNLIKAGKKPKKKVAEVVGDQFVATVTDELPKV